MGGAASAHQMSSCRLGNDPQTSVYNTSANCTTPRRFAIGDARDADRQRCQSDDLGDVAGSPHRDQHRQRGLSPPSTPREENHDNSDPDAGPRPHPHRRPVGSGRHCWKPCRWSAPTPNRRSPASRPDFLPTSTVPSPRRGGFPGNGRPPRSSGSMLDAVAARDCRTAATKLAAIIITSGSGTPLITPWAADPRSDYRQCRSPPCVRDWSPTWLRGVRNPATRWSSSVEPVSAVAAIAPWNYPLHQMARAKVAKPALAAGCKSSSLKPQRSLPSTLRLMEMSSTRSDRPGVVNMVTGLGATVRRGDDRHPGVNMVTFHRSGG